jgi:uncharacterized protein (TIGR02246 family)
MKRLFRIGMIASILLVAGNLCPAMAQIDNPLIGSAVSAADEAAIRAILDRQTDAWNRHDMDAFVADAMTDVDWVNVVGMHWEGRETVRRAHAVLHKGMFSNSRMLPPEITMIREIAPNVVVETHVNRIEGATVQSSGAAYPDSGNLISMVFVKTEAGWRIAHAHNTTIDGRAAAHDPAKKD